MLLRQNVVQMKHQRLPTPDTRDRAHNQRLLGIGIDQVIALTHPHHGLRHGENIGNAQ